MIRFSKMTDYGVLLLGHFARAEGAQSSTTELAELYHLPKPVVANLLKEFGRAGLLTSRRGLHGRDIRQRTIRLIEPVGAKPVGIDQ